MNDVTSAAKLVSIGLTPLVLAAALAVIASYGRTAVRNGIPSKYEHWLVLGIAIGFFGKLCDNAFWAAAWAADANGNGPQWFQFGPLANIPFRQIALIVSASCHMMAIRRMDPPRLHWVKAVCYITGGLALHAGCIWLGFTL